MSAAATHLPLVVRFAPPDAGWIDITIAARQDRVEYNLSNVYDPFYDGFTRWLEDVSETGQGKLTINDEREYIDFEVVSGALPGQCVFTCIESQFRERVDFRTELPLREFVLIFYSSLVAYWESAELRDNWAQWIFPDDYEDGRPVWDDDLPSAPWSVRSTKVESYLEAIP